MTLANELLLPTASAVFVPVLLDHLKKMDVIAK